MKKLFPIIILLVVAAGVWYFITSPGNKTVTPAENLRAAQSTSSTDMDGDTDNVPPGRNLDPGTMPGAVEDDEEKDYEDDIRPATEVYSSADEAFEAVKKGAEDYDDLVLEQFADLGEECRWCPLFYDRVKSAMLGETASEDERSYFAEVLAISGKPENLSALISAINEAPNEDAADVYAEALEVAMGDDKTVGFLGENLDTPNGLLKESVIAAITNHGSPLAIDLLYKETVKQKDPDGYYSLGIGLGEVIPDEASLPYLSELANKRDPYSHLAVKALLNYGTEGLRMVMDTVSNSSDIESDRRLLEDAIDHVNYEEETEQYVRELKKTSKHPVVLEFADQVLDEFELEDEGGEDKELEP